MWCGLSSSGDTSLLLKVNSCNGFILDKPNKTHLYSVQMFSIFSKRNVSLGFSYSTALAKGLFELFWRLDAIRHKQNYMIPLLLTTNWG